MLDAFFSHVLDDPIYIGNNEYLTIVTQGKNNNIEGITKDTNPKAGILRVNADTGSYKFIDLYTHSESGDRYRAGVKVDNKVYIMRTQKQFVDSKVRIAVLNLDDNSVEMIVDDAVTIHGSPAPKLFCGHFNFGRPTLVGKKIVYPPLNSGVLIVFDTETKQFITADVTEKFSSIWSTFVTELNQVVFFPYGDVSDTIMTLDMATFETKFVKAPVASTFYNAFSKDGKAYGVPLMLGQADVMNFWTYDGSKITASEYTPFETETYGSMGFKYGVVEEGKFITHTCWDKSKEVVKFDLATGTIERIKTDLELGATPVQFQDNVYLFPSIQSVVMQDAPSSVYKLENDVVVKAFDLPNNNVSYSPINGAGDKLLLVPYKFDFDQADSKVTSQLTIVDLASKSAKSIDIELAVA
jgi:hypothetical protein